MQFHRAQTLDEALDLLGELGDDALVLAGGTDAVIQYLAGEIAPEAFVHIEGIEDLTTVSLNHRTTLGPLVTHRVLATDEVIGAVHPALAASARTVGGWQTQAVGTIGGNICNASPAADTVPPLLVADAYVTLASRRGRRRLALMDFFLDRRQTVMDPDEMLTAIDLDPLPRGSGEVYLKVGRRGAMEVALVGMAVRIGFAADGTVDSARIALCSVAPTPRRVPDAEKALIGSRLDGGVFDAAGEALRAAACPIDDARASASYRRRTLGGLLERAAIQCREAVTS
ncbi:MAG: xanthine dehydrogenase family protein subunit M [Acidobacteria bacterium]|nr:xanthine dehydrogenase family protein subunit M [Acidobacteriota bacterium]